MFLHSSRRSKRGFGQSVKPESKEQKEVLDSPKPEEVIEPKEEISKEVIAEEKKLLDLEIKKKRKEKGKD